MSTIERSASAVLLWSFHTQWLLSLYVTDAQFLVNEWRQIVVGDNSIPCALLAISEVCRQRIYSQCSQVHPLIELTVIMSAISGGNAHI